ncbi:MAG: hypothetical protein ACI8ZN_000353 [Bacteroidia bacterium]|jgi:hypothetical protein
MKPNQLTNLLAFFAFCLFLSFPKTSFAQLGGNAFSALSKIPTDSSVWWVNNPSCQPPAGTHLGAYYTQRLLVNELKTIGLCASIHKKQSSYAGSVEYFGYAISNVTQFTLSIQQQLFPKLSLGIGAQYLRHFVKESTSNRLCSVTWRSDYQINTQTSVFLWAKVPTKTNELPNEFVHGIGIRNQFTDHHSMLIQYEWSMNAQPTYAILYIFRLSTALDVQLGWSQNPNYFGFGVRWSSKHLKGQIWNRQEAKLGFSPVLVVETQPIFERS